MVRIVGRACASSAGAGTSTLDIDAKDIVMYETQTNQLNNSNQNAPSLTLSYSY